MDQEIYLYIAAVDVHAADHTALCGDISPVDHLFPVVKVQSYSIIQALKPSRQKTFLHVAKE